LDEVVESYRDFDFDYYLAHEDEMPEQIPNEDSAIRAWLTRERAARQ
jgi:hypothetical protein